MINLYSIKNSKKLIEKQKKWIATFIVIALLALVSCIVLCFFLKKYETWIIATLIFAISLIFGYIDIYIMYSIVLENYKEAKHERIMLESEKIKLEGIITFTKKKYRIKKSISAIICELKTSDNQTYSLFFNERYYDYKKFECFVNHHKVRVIVAHKFIIGYEVLS